MHLQHAAVVADLDFIGVHRRGQRDGALEPAVAPLPPAVARFLLLCLFLALGLDGQGVAADVDIESAWSQCVRTRATPAPYPSWDDRYGRGGVRRSKWSPRDNSTASLPLDGDAPRLGGFRLGQMHGQDAVSVFRRDPVRVDQLGDSEGSVEVTNAILAPQVIGLLLAR